jgi:hypothetical protein
MGSGHVDRTLSKASPAPLTSFNWRLRTVQRTTHSLQVFDRVLSTCPDPCLNLRLLQTDPLPCTSVSCASRSPLPIRAAGSVPHATSRLRQVESATNLDFLRRPAGYRSTFTRGQTTLPHLVCHEHCRTDGIDVTVLILHENIRGATLRVTWRKIAWRTVA